ncbi:metal-nicotianamine transporter YSL3 isoform X1 [Prunus yedoensis var. nudiflora]|uniref:Metal-nicotianamine transporter YSL3 isoform X1 n=1 Tax=Prunus yedoensis var. nudiflora TaxID=2094558 RepID=A0A314XRW7_PRUYE|nr:metal-nicotianamine transporter YSL3 isoform X1 [Prunus yedoensis var. nudiflora]
MGKGQMGSTNNDEKGEIEMFEREDGVEENGGEPEDLNRIIPWTRQITIRGLVASIVIGTIYSVIVMKLNLTTGLVPNLNVLLLFWPLYSSAHGLSFFRRLEFCMYSIAVGGRLMSKQGLIEGNTPGSTKEPQIGWMTGFLFVSSFVGLLALVPLRKIMIIDYKLSYPSGTATAVLINGFHTPKGDKMAKKQVQGFMKFFSMSFLWSFFQWFYSGGDQCGFVQFPTFGLAAWKNSFYFDFSMTYIGAGMICSHLVNLSLLLGAVLSWGIMWPLIRGLKGEWFPATLSESSMKSLNGYKVFISIALILGDGLYNFLKILYFTGSSIHTKMNNKNPKTVSKNQNQALDDLRRNEVFIRDSIPIWVACLGYTLFSITPS